MILPFFWLWTMLADPSTIRRVQDDGARSSAAAAAVVMAAAAAATPELPREVLLAIAHVESRFDPTATSRVQDGRRKTGRWASTAQAGTGPWFCGLAQARATTWSACLRLRDPYIGLMVAVAEITGWLRRTRGDLTLALRGHGCGNAGLRHSCRGYAERVLRRVPRYRAKPAS